MNKKSLPKLFTVFYLVTAVLATVLAVWEMGCRESGKIPVITYAGTEQYILLTVLGAILVVCAVFTYWKGNLVLPSVTVRKCPVSGIFSALSAIGFLWQGAIHLTGGSALGDYLLTVLAVLSGGFLMYMAVIHFTGGTDGIGNMMLAASLMPLIYFLARLTLLFFSESSFYPTVDNVLEQIIMTMSLLFFLGLNKDIWVSGAEYGRKLMILAGTFTFVLVLVRIIAPVIFGLMNGSADGALADMIRTLLYLPLSVYMTCCSFHMVKHSV